MAKKVKITETELRRLMIRSGSENPLPLRFGPGWVAIDCTHPDSDMHIQALEKMRGQAAETI